LVQGRGIVHLLAPPPNWRGGWSWTIAKVAAARELLTLVFYGLRDGHIRCLTHDQTAA
jgi:hypothetical protein